MIRSQPAINDVVLVHRPETIVCDAEAPSLDLSRPVAVERNDCFGVAIDLRRVAVSVPDLREKNLQVGVVAGYPVDRSVKELRSPDRRLLLDGVDQRFEPLLLDFVRGDKSRRSASQYCDSLHDSSGL